jgi:hypothetical protein
MKLYDWTELNSVHHSIITRLCRDWEGLIDENKNERFYQNFLAEHAGFFLSDWNANLVISKLKMGSELECDFVVVKDGHSAGTIYEFIEIEKPGSKLFTKDGIPSKDFNTSLQQIRDWRRWLIENKGYFKKFLPSLNTRVLNDSQIKFKIIIGRRSERINLEKRNQIANENNIEIRSFDSLSDKLRGSLIHGELWHQRKDKESFSLINKISSPFLKAITDSSWKKLCESKSIPSGHFYSNVDSSIYKHLKFNKLFDLYKNL